MTQFGNDARLPPRDPGTNGGQANRVAPALPSTPGDAATAIKLFHAEVRRNLVEIGLNSTPPRIETVDTPLVELSRNLQDAEATTRGAFIAQLITASLNTPHVRRDVIEILPCILRYTSVTEKGDLVRMLLESKVGGRRDRFALATEIFRACPDLGDLRSLCDIVGPESLRRTRSAQMLEVLARAHYLELLRTVRTPPLVCSGASHDLQQQHRDELRQTLLEARRLIRADRQLARTPFGRRLATIVNANLQLLRGQADDETTPEQSREQINSLNSKIRLEFRYGIALTVHSGRGQARVAQWSTAELREIERTLQRVPEPLLTLSRHLATIQKSAVGTSNESGDHPRGRWIKAAGAIELESGFTADLSDTPSPGGCSLGTTLARLIGSAYQTDRGYDTSPPRLESYHQIAGWSIVPPERYRSASTLQTAIIDGVPYRLAPAHVTFDGHPVTLVYDPRTRTLYSRAIGAGRLSDGARDSYPDVHFATDFADYVQRPEHLAGAAPATFSFFEASIGRPAAAAHGAGAAWPQVSRRHLSDATTLERGVERSTVFEAFMIERFDQMTRGEQSWILANLRFLDEQRSDRSQIYALYRTYKTVRPEIRRTHFLDYVGQPVLYSHVGDLLRDVMVQYKPATLALIAARLRGAEIGVLTLRSSRDGNAAHIESIARFTGYAFDRRNLYFVSDETLNTRIRALPGGPAKKSQILGDFAAGTYIDRNGETQTLSRQYGRVIFYEDEAHNLAAARRRATQFPDGRLVVIDATKINPVGVWDTICTRLLEGRVRPRHSAKEFVFFDLDGTMFDTAATIGVIDIRSGVIVRRLSPAEFGSKPGDGWLDDVAAADRSIDRTALAFDFGDFSRAERIALQVNYPRHLRHPAYKSTRERNRRLRTGRQTE